MALTTARSMTLFAALPVALFAALPVALPVTLPVTLVAALPVTLVACVAEPWPDDYVSSGDDFFIDVAAGGYHTCGVLDDGTAVCWGCEDDEFDHGQCDVPESTSLQHVYAGTRATCGLDTGVLTCWGSSDLTDLMVGTPLSDGDFVQASVGGTFACGTDGDDGYCWGAADPWLSHEVLNVGIEVTRISAGYAHYCLIHSDGSVECQGDDGSRQATPPAGIMAVEIAAATSHTCALLDDGTIECWGCDGASNYGQCDVPEVLLDDIASGEAVRQLVAGKRHTCALMESRDIQCWGCENSDGDYDAELCEPWYFVDQMDLISAGGEHNCGMTPNGHVTCWGNDESGQRDPP